MKQKKMQTEAIPTVIDLEKNFILILKPEEMIKSEAQKKTTANPNHARYMIAQLFDEIEQREMLDSEELRDIRFLLDDYFENNSTETKPDFYHEDNLRTIDDDYDEQWDTPYDDDNQINIIY